MPTPATSATIRRRHAASDPVHALPTQALAPRKKSATDSHHTKYTTTTSPAEAMRLEEIARSQVFP